MWRYVMAFASDSQSFLHLQNFQRNQQKRLSLSLSLTLCVLCHSSGGGNQKNTHVFVFLRPPKKRFLKKSLPTSGRCFGSFGRCYAWASYGCGVVEGGLWCIRHHLCWEGCCWTPSRRLGCGGAFLVVGKGLKRWKTSKRLGRGRYVVLLWLRLSDKRGVSVVLCGSI